MSNKMRQKEVEMVGLAACQKEFVTATIIIFCPSSVRKGYEEIVNMEAKLISKLNKVHVDFTAVIPIWESSA